MKIHAASLALYGAVAFITLNSCAALAGTGHAVHYHDKYQGRKTANGEVFDQKADEEFGLSRAMRAQLQSKVCLHGAHTDYPKFYL